MLLCNIHYQRLSVYGRTNSLKDEKRNRICDYCGIHNSEIAIYTTTKFEGHKHLCRKHYDIMDKYGKITVLINRETNEFVLKDDLIIMDLYDVSGVKIDETIVSSQHKDLIENHKWWRFTNGNRFYVQGQNKTTKENVWLHRLIIESIFNEIPSGCSVDHINRNGLDNRDGNLRIASYNTQSSNQKMKKHNTSGVSGVSRTPNGQRWRARLQYKDINYCKVFDKFSDAVDQRIAWEKIRDERIREEEAQLNDFTNCSS